MSGGISKDNLNKSQDHCLYQLFTTQLPSFILHIIEFHMILQNQNIVHLINMKLAF